MDVEVDIDEMYRMEGPNHYLSLATVRILEPETREGMQVSAQIATLKKLEVEQPPTEASEIIDAQELAARLKLPKSWILEGTRSRAVDPIPHLKFGRYVRFRWGSRELTQWLERRAGGRKPE